METQAISLSGRQAPRNITDNATRSTSYGVAGPRYMCSASAKAISNESSRTREIIIPIPRTVVAYQAGVHWPESVQRNVVFLLKLSLAGVFFWFGLLKVANVSPVVSLLKASFPFMAVSPYIEILGVAEVIIAVGLVIDGLSKHATALMILHLLGTLSVVVLAPGIIFAPAFPVLTIDGEFLLKNLVLIMAGLVVMFSTENQSRFAPEVSSIKDRRASRFR